MPVQFTCPHCNQLLGVARRKVGTVVRCVTCNGRVMVPPPIDAQPTVPNEMYPYQESPTSNLQFRQAAATADLLSQTENPLGHATPTAQSPDVATQDFATEQPSSRHPEPDSQFEDRIVPPIHLPNGPILISRAAIYGIGGLIIGVAICSFALGWAMSSTLTPVRAQTVNKQRVSGRVAYYTSSGQLAADALAVVIALPHRKKPDEKFEVRTVRPENTSLQNQNLNPTVLGIRSLGGDFAVTNERGDYELEVSESGEYHLLVLSSHLARPANRMPLPNEIVELGRYFRQANELLGNNDYVWAKRLVRKDSRFDATFGTN